MQKFNHTKIISAIIFLIAVFLIGLYPAGCLLAQDFDNGSSEDEIAETENENGGLPAVPAIESFEAKVIKILDQKELTREDASIVIQQNLLLSGLSGKWQGKEVVYNGISDIEVANAGAYKIGDKVLVSRSINSDGMEEFYVTDFVRRGYLYLLGAIFCLIIILIGRKKGIKSLISLIISFVIIIKYILPSILNGGNPLISGLIGAFFILTIMIYLTEGWSRKSYLSVLSVFAALFLTLIFSWLFTSLTRLSGMSEDAVFLIGLSKSVINFQGLLLAGMLIGAIGVLDDVIVSQIEVVNQIKTINPQMRNSEVFKSAFKVGTTHLGTMVNTLFLTYAGASLPLLLLFTVNQGEFLTFSQVINNEVIATEIIRTLVGSIGVALSMPIATFLGAYRL
ncbi:MAG: YibE/F family protein [Candidatus Falkowbacteria bacterium GW2011_GWC2_38_22]|uniref:YibE/F family protein n=1 Tax=Candidatus Falkowbacteria bacterium GW2011_GWE1_38_31 TaxID=1618638 RepID=A0A0G0N0Z3_9BACT|nr:MAG: YibE/F family protein [Candidatus Falkowbacteria bacterium GW2011_GWF2_38_1205]KKQ61922.1 MAG: YibE/F family protein [Candidatus Falkowbacteria bacterium GW2011_GWC2_38_22]KKQ63916.1 MAG: YibE/F family protein [Candidatus Falkowbacteria bacterium GW2011_GWF1_38_22]KKQ66173.1 MAG: YibE/F family protein [Candidatus Falkowbacteria bacterium GW2011_GWE2_38_254]KKQ70776.1 MAG: YibE/F family protein [Candidatus Falkowbacteria bacterium GW2011_GWE1_38_31]KKQ73146.1 MAG: YibE/F family protein 